MRAFNRVVTTVALLIVPVVVSCGGESGDGGSDVSHTAVEGAEQNLGGIVLTIPDAWVIGTPTSQMRAAQYVLPAQDGGSDANLVVFYFGSGSAGSVSANLARWYGQITQPDGRPSSEVATVDEQMVSGMKVTMVDVSGTYSASMGPMMQGGAAQANSRMLAAIVESPRGAYYFKLTGPENTVAHWKSLFDAVIGGVRPS